MRGRWYWWAIFALFVVLGMAAAISSVKDQRRCEEQNGVYIVSRTGMHLCIDPAALK